MSLPYAIAIGAALLVIGLAIFWLRRGRRECPGCSRRISARATICPKCGVDIAAALARSARSEMKGRAR